MSPPIHEAWQHLTRLPETLVREVQWAQMEILGLGPGAIRSLDLLEREAERREFRRRTSGPDAEWLERRS